MAWYGWVLLTVAVLAIVGVIWLGLRLWHLLGHTSEAEVVRERDRYLDEYEAMSAADEVQAWRMAELAAAIEEVDRELAAARGVPTVDKSPQEVADALRALGFRSAHVRRSGER